MLASKRPLSPFMIGPYYKPQMTSILSITHRITGTSLVIGSLVLVYWLVSAACGPDCYQHAQSILGSMLGQLFLFLWTWALFYHLSNGIRHLFWDAGIGFGLNESTKSGWLVILSSVVLTILCWLIAAP